MICELEDHITSALVALKGEYLQLNRYRLGDNEPNDGYVLSGASEYYFIKAENRVVDDKYEILLLLTERVENEELGEDIHFELLVEGTLTDIHLFKRTISNMVVNGAAIPDLTTECAMMLNFVDQSHYFIYPKERLFGHSSLETNLDKILDIINKLGLKHSRTL